MLSTSDAQFIVDHGKVYINHGEYLLLSIWSKNRTYLLKLAAYAGGHVYKHRSGTIWIVGKKVELLALLTVCEPLDTHKRLNRLYAWGQLQEVDPGDILIADDEPRLAL